MQTSAKHFEFRGEAGEFFKIWIVNIVLSIVTLGIYSAWAKVRTKRYFYSNTLLMNTPFDYLADPLKILKGRLLAFGLILLYSLSALLSPVLQGAVLIIILFALPWIIIKALKFNLYNSAYRNIRFSFDADYLRALGVFIGFPILVPLTLGLAYPAFVRARKKFVIDHSAYGTSTFTMEATNGQFYGVYLKAAGIMLLAVLAAVALARLNQSLSLASEGSAVFALLFFMLLIWLPLFITIYGYLYTSISNLVINHTGLQQCRFESALTTAAICRLYIVNTLAIMLSLGLLIPWAMIRTARYRLSCLTMVSSGDMNAFIAAEAEKAEALGEELDDLLDLDIGL
ncbi:MAG: YjgN family protein [Methylomonas sp.]|nr:YjgN family protein [Methylomonas sp.]